MSSQPLPTLYVSHGSPTTILEDSPARTFLETLGSPYQNVSAVLCVSAHWETTLPTLPTVSAVELPETIHDFYGFPPELYAVQYPAKGSPQVAERVASLLKEANLPVEVNPRRGLDHGTWTPLKLMFPKADVPVLQLSILRGLNPQQHLAVGKAIEALRHENILVIGSGTSVHPLGYVTDWPLTSIPAWAQAFDAWLTDAVLHGDVDTLLRFRELAPYPERAHPRPDHYVPLLTVLGAAGEGAKGTVLHQSWQYNFLSMGMYAFE